MQVRFLFSSLFVILGLKIRICILSYFIQVAFCYANRAGRIIRRIIQNNAWVPDFWNSAFSAFNSFKVSAKYVLMSYRIQIRSFNWRSRAYCWNCFLVRLMLLPCLDDHQWNSCESTSFEKRKESHKRSISLNFLATPAITAPAHTLHSTKMSGGS